MGSSTKSHQTATVFSVLPPPSPNQVDTPGQRPYPLLPNPVYCPRHLQAWWACQGNDLVYYYRSHTSDSKDDEANIDAIYSVGPLLEKTRPRVVTFELSVGPLLKKTRPRVVTFEQAPGLIRTNKHRDHWYALIHQITSNGYSVRCTTPAISEPGGHARATTLSTAV